jgi:hypothetical protein
MIFDDAVVIEKMPSFFNTVVIQIVSRNILPQISHELIQRRSQPFEWKDEFCKETLQVLAQHAVQVWIHLINRQE